MVLGFLQLTKLSFCGNTTISVWERKINDVWVGESKGGVAKQVAALSPLIYVLGMWFFRSTLIFFYLYLRMQLKGVKEKAEKKPATHCSFKERVIIKTNFGCRGVFTLPS